MLSIMKIIYDRGYYFEKIYEGASSSDNISNSICCILYSSISSNKIEANQSVAASDRTYDTEIKIYKDQKDEPSMVSQYIKDPKVAIVAGKKL